MEGARSLQASLGLHRAKIDALRDLEERLNARIARLGELSLSVKTLIDSGPLLLSDLGMDGKDGKDGKDSLPVLPISVESEVSVQATLSNPHCEPQCAGSPKSPSSRRGVNRSVSWVSPDEERPVCAKEDAPRFPPHGHWVPADLLERRASFQGEAAQKLGGRQVQLETKLGNVPCILVEPMGKLLSPDEFISVGVAIVFQEAPHSGSSVEEWAQVLKRTKLLDAGLSVAFPDLGQALLQRKEEGVSGPTESTELAADFQEVFNAILSSTKEDFYILCGKGKGAHHAMDLAARNSAKVVSAILFAPTSPPPSSCQSFPGPVMLVWAQDDKKCPFENAPLWAEQLGCRDDAVAVLRDPSVGGHDLARVLRKDERTATDMLAFVAAVLLVAELPKLKADLADGQNGRKSHVLRLLEELPQHLLTQLMRQQVGMKSEGTEGHADDLAAALLAHVLEQPQAANSIMQALREWINNDMPSGASASE
ncbi:PGA3 [Symbiodinium natans]|uniref:PGA3 protein n=1 Tax=Symbiodinium natans TaxID=878477 RepID=A0A812QQ03_9DINO|nr:PGA3 [Symbiodinium natans]